MHDKPNRIKQALSRGETVYAMWAHLASAEICEIAVWKGFPVILLDNEHGLASLSRTLEILRTVEGAGGELIVRAPANDEPYIKKLLDIGVRSIMVPMVNSSQEARDAVASCLYPPRGTRSFAAPIVRASNYGNNEGYGNAINDDVMIILQIEHVDAVANIEAIADVNGVDVLFIGPNDLAGSIGKPGQLDDAEFLQMYDDAAQRIVKSGTVLGTITFGGNDAKAFAARGARFIAGASDVSLFSNAVQSDSRAQIDLCPMIADLHNRIENS